MVQPRTRHVWVYPQGEPPTAGLALEMRQSTRGWEVLVAYVLTTPKMRPMVLGPILRSPDEVHRGCDLGETGRGDDARLVDVNREVVDKGIRGEPGAAVTLVAGPRKHVRRRCKPLLRTHLR